MKVPVVISCCLCPQKYETEVDIPDEWGLREYSELYYENGFCPKHTAIIPWPEAQCSGCAGGWGDCSLWTDFAHNKQDLTEEDLEKIASGECPRRTNGTIFFSQEEGLKEIDLSERADSVAGIALVEAIKEYWQRYLVT